MIVVSVIIPVYNCDKFLEESALSILKQSFRDVELILIDNCSTDSSVEIIKKLSRLDPRVVPVFNEANLGLPASLNRALKVAKGKYIARMDADDIARPERIQRQVDFLERNLDVDVLGTWWQYFPGNTQIQAPVTHSEIKIYALTNNPMGHPTVMFRREKMLKVVGFYDETAFPIEDYEYWVRGLEKLKFANLPEVLLDYRIHSSQISFEKARQQMRASKRLRLKIIRPLIPNVRSSIRIIDILDGRIARNISQRKMSELFLGFFASNLLKGSFDRVKLGIFLLHFWRMRRNIIRARSANPG